MNFDYLKYKIPNTLISLEVYFENSEMKYNSFLLSNKNGKVGIKELVKKEKLNRGLPMVLNISTEEIIVKNFQTDDEVQSFLSSFNSDAFYIQKIKSKNFILINLIRIEILDEILAHRTFSEYKIIAINLNGAIVLDFLNRTSIPKTTFKCGSHNYFCDEISWQYDFVKESYSSKEIRLLSESLEEKMILPFISGFYLFEGNSMHFFLYKKEISKTLDDLVFHHNSIQLIKTALLLCFVLFGFHYAISSILNISKSKLQDNNLAQSSLIQKHEKLLVENKQLEETIMSNGLHMEVPLSFLLDQIASKGNGKIKFERIQVNRAHFKQNFKKKPNNSIQCIIIQGHSKNSQYLNNWTKALKKLDLFKSVIINEVRANSENSIDFELQVNLNP